MIRHIELDGGAGGWWVRQALHIRLNNYSGMHCVVHTFHTDPALPVKYLGYQPV